MSREVICIPGLPIKRYDPNVSPQQDVCPHIIEVYKIVDDDVIFDGFYPNTRDYPEYVYIIQNFIDNSPDLKKLVKKTGIGSS